MFKWEKKIIDIFEKDYLLLGFIIVTLIALLTRFYMLDYKSGDFNIYLGPWFDYLKDNGGLKALATYPGDYNAPYMTIMALLTYIPLDKLYLIKGFSIIFDFALAISSACLVKFLVSKNKNEFFLLTYSIILFLPEVLMNSSLWGQCDSGYATFIILALLYLLKEKYVKSFILLGVAFALKLQFIFILPLFIVIYVSQKKFSFIHFLIIPVVDLVLSIPAIMMGKPLIDVLTVYFNQTETYSDRLTLNFPNIYTILTGWPSIFYKVGTLVTVAACAMMLGFIIYKKIKWNNEKILNLGLWFVVIVTFLLPCMHERYLFVGEILAVICYILYKKNLSLTIFVVFSSVVTYSSFLFGAPTYYLPYMGAIYTVIIVYFTRDTLRLLSES